MGRPRKYESDDERRKAEAERKRAARAKNGPVKDPKHAVARAETTDPSQTERWEGIGVEEAYGMGYRGEDVPRAEPDEDHPEGLCVWSNAVYEHLEQAWARGVWQRQGEEDERVHVAKQAAWMKVDPTEIARQRAERAAAYAAWVAAGKPTKP